jgi:hypothetical protein
MEPVWERILEIIDGKVPPFWIITGTQYFYRFVESNIDFLFIWIKLAATVFHNITRVYFDSHLGDYLAIDPNLPFCDIFLASSAGTGTAPGHIDLEPETFFIFEFFI